MRSTTCSVEGSTPTGIRTVNAPTTTSIAGVAWRSGCDGAATTIDANSNPSALAICTPPCSAFRRQANSCCAVSPCRRATALTVAPSAQLSATICAFCSIVQERRHPVPVKTSNRQTGSALDISISSVSDMCSTPLLQTEGVCRIGPRLGGRSTNIAYIAHGDWIIDEILVAENGFVSHEIEFSEAGAWNVICRDIAYRWRGTKDIAN